MPLLVLLVVVLLQVVVVAASMLGRLCRMVEGGWSRLETSRAFPCTTPSAKYTKKIDNKQIRTFFISLWAKYGQGQWELGLNKDIIMLRIYHEFIMFYSSDGAGIYKMQEGEE